ncbi:MAG: hypothetical protein R2911_07480 [Caldilineaceae bacterium]
MNDLPKPEAPKVLWERQRQLQLEAAAVLQDLEIVELLTTVGTVVQVGSVALELMVWREIDFTILCPQLDLAQIFALGARLVAHSRVRGLHFRNDTGDWNQDPRYPDGLFWEVDYVSAAKSAWEMDIWFIHESTRQPDMRHLEEFLPRLTDETRLAILTMKDVWRRTPLYGNGVSGYDCYTAVLDHGVRTIDEFAAYLAQRDRTR